MDKLKILIAEDDKDLLALYQKALPDHIFEKRLANDGKAAMDIYEQWRPDIVVLDILMPKKKGDTVLIEIREVVKDRNTTVIISTSIDDIDEVKKCERYGIQGYIVKPFNYKRIAYEVLDYFEKTDPERAKRAKAQLLET